MNTGLYFLKTYDYLLSSVISLLVAQNPAEAEKAYPEKVLRLNYPKSYEYLNHFRSILENRAVYKKFLKPNGAPFYAFFDFGPYTFARYKVVWRYVASEMTAAVIGYKNNKEIIPDSKLNLVPFDNEDEAHYLCSILNSTPARFVVKSYSVETQISTHVLENLLVPTFSNSISIHNQLSSLSIEAHRLKSDIHSDGVSNEFCFSAQAQLYKVEDEIDQLAAELWGITQEELQDIKRSLDELK